MEKVSHMDVKFMWGNSNYDYVFSEAAGNSGGILCIWEESFFKKDYVTISDSFVAIYGTWIPSKTKLLVVSIYVPQQPSLRRVLWEYLLILLGRWNGEAIYFNGAIYRMDIKMVGYRLTWSRPLAEKIENGIPLRTSYDFVIVKLHVGLWNDFLQVLSFVVSKSLVLIIWLWVNDKKIQSAGSKNSIVSELRDIDKRLDQNGPIDSLIFRRQDLMSNLNDLKEMEDMGFVLESKSDGRLMVTRTRSFVTSNGSPSDEFHIHRGGLKQGDPAIAFSFLFLLWKLCIYRLLLYYGNQVPLSWGYGGGWDDSSKAWVDCNFKASIAFGLNGKFLKAVLKVMERFHGDKLDSSFSFVGFHMEFDFDGKFKLLSHLDLIFLSRIALKRIGSVKDLVYAMMICASLYSERLGGLSYIPIKIKVFYVADETVGIEFPALAFVLRMDEVVLLIRLPGSVKGILEEVFYVAWWFIWGFRNRSTFDVNKLSRSILFENIVSALSLVYLVGVA
ncbi:hypothetical protein Tco_0658236 [Tanacetum coccineum]